VDPGHRTKAVLNTAPFAAPAAGNASTGVTRRVISKQKLASSSGELNLRLTVVRYIWRLIKVRESRPSLRKARSRDGPRRI
jgi:hypothetical protein